MCCNVICISDCTSWYSEHVQISDEMVLSTFTGYVESMKRLLFTLPKHAMKEVLDRYSKKAPKPLSAQFADRLDKQEAVNRYEGRIKKSNTLFPSGMYSLILGCLLLDNISMYISFCTDFNLQFICSSDFIVE